MSCSTTIPSALFIDPLELISKMGPCPFLNRAASAGAPSRPTPTALRRTSSGEGGRPGRPEVISKVFLK